MISALAKSGGVSLPGKSSNLTAAGGQAVPAAAGASVATFSGLQPAAADPTVEDLGLLDSSPSAAAEPAAAVDSAEHRAAVLRVGQAIGLAVERFVTVGETIGDGNPEIKVEIFEACKEAHAAGCAIEKLCAMQVGASCVDAGGSVTRAGRLLLASVTKVLLLADTVVVKQLILAKDKTTRTLSRLESVNNFTEFVKAFSQFGQEMVELARLTGSRQNDLKDERRRAQIAAAGLVLERSSAMLLTSSKAVMRHTECARSRENRDTVFCQMRRAMDLIHFVVKDGFSEAVGRQELTAPGSSKYEISTTEDWDSNQTLIRVIQRYEECVEMTRVTLCCAAYRERLLSLLETICDRSQDFTDSAYTSHHAREHILMLSNRTKLDLDQLLALSAALERREPTSPSREYDEAIMKVLRSTQDLLASFQAVAMEQASELVRGVDGESEVISGMKNSAVASNTDRLEEMTFRFQDHSDHVQEVCKLLRHVAPTETLQIAAKYSEINVRLFGPQLISAAQALCLHHSSKVAKENFEAFADMWLNLVGDVKVTSRETSECLRTYSQTTRQREYTGVLPRPGKHTAASKQMTQMPPVSDLQDRDRFSKSGPDVKSLAGDEVDTDKWQGANDEDNDMLRRARNLAQMAQAMHEFTYGDGALKTTQDLFTQAEYFTEEANRLYKVVRQFSYQVPQGLHKKDMLELLDQIPTHVQQLQFAVKLSTVGKAATFTKVDNVIQANRNAMEAITKVVNMCFTCASKYNLNFRGLSPRGNSNAPYRADGGDDMSLSSGAGANASQSGSSDPNI